MLFVTAASNLRSYVFKIQPQSLYEAKGVAGNIIPAIATTNAIVAGLQIIELFKILRNMSHPEPKSLIDVCRYTYCLRHQNRKGQLLQPVRLEEPVPTCFVCSQTQVHVQLDTATWTLDQFLGAVVKKRLGFSEPTIMLGTGEIWMEGQDADDLSINLPKTLNNLPQGGVQDGQVLCISDFSQDLEVNVAVHHRTHFDEEEEPEGYRMGAPALPAAAEQDEAASAGPAAEPMGDVELAEETKKRQAPDSSDGGAQRSKRARGES